MVQGKKQKGAKVEKGDLIRRQQVLDEIKRMKKVFSHDSSAEYVIGVVLVLAALEGVTRAIPAAEEEIKTQTINELRDRICMYLADWQLSEMDYDVNYTIGEAINAVAEIAESFKGGVE